MPLAATTNVTTTASTGAGGNPNVIKKTEFFVKRFLEPFRKELITLQLAAREVLPRGEGTVMKWILPDAEVTAPVTTLITEGVDPSDSVDLAFTTISATIEQRGAYMEITDLAEYIAIDGTMTAYIDALSYHARLVLDDQVLTELAAFAGATQDAGAAITAEELRKGAVALRQSSVPRHPSTPGGQFYCFLGSVESGYDLVGEGAPAWFQAKQTAELQASLTSPLAATPPASAIYDVIVKTTDNIKRDAAASPDDDINFLLGKDAFGISELSPQGANVSLIVKPASQGGLASPLNLRGIAGWKMQYKVKGLRASALRKILSDATGIGI